MTNSKYYFAWSIGYFTIIFGFLIFITTLFLHIGASLGLTNYARFYPYYQGTSLFQVILEPLTYGLHIGFFGFLIVGIRNRILTLTNKLEENSAISRQKNFTISGLIGGFISIAGIMIFVLILAGSLRELLEERFCYTHPNDFHCGFYPYKDLSSENLMDTFYTNPFNLFFIMFLFITPLLIGQFIVIIGAWIKIARLVSRQNIAP